MQLKFINVFAVIKWYIQKELLVNEWQKSGNISSILYQLLLVLWRVVGRAEETSMYSWLKVLYCKLLTSGKQLPAFSHEVRFGLWCQRWAASVLPVHHRAPPPPLALNVWRTFLYATSRVPLIQPLPVYQFNLTFKNIAHWHKVKWRLL